MSNFRRPDKQRLDPQVRQIIVYQSETLCWSTAQISHATDIPLRTIQRVLFRWRMLGEIVQDPRREGPPKKLSDQHIQVRIAQVTL